MQVWDVDAGKLTWSSVANFSKGLLSPTAWKGEWIAAEYTDKDGVNVVVLDQITAKDVGIANLDLGSKAAKTVPRTDVNAPIRKISATLCTEMVRKASKSVVQLPLQNVEF